MVRVPGLLEEKASVPPNKPEHHINSIMEPSLLNPQIQDSGMWGETRLQLWTWKHSPALSPVSWPQQEPPFLGVH